MKNNPLSSLPRFLLERLRPAYYIVALVLCLILESLPFIDVAVQNLFFVNDEWLVNQCMHDDNRTLFYSGPKKIVMFGWILAAAGLVFAVLYRRKRPAAGKFIKPCLLITLSISCIPLIVNFLKWLTGVYCPEELDIYGGSEPYLGFLGALFLEGGIMGGRCFPAGHSSGGFAFMSLYFLPLNDKAKSALFYTGLAYGWFMALYQMFRGQHFLSHSLFTMFIALLFISVAARLLRLAEQKNNVS